MDKTCQVNQQEFECCICFNSASCRVILDSCMTHMFCRNCILRWMSNNDESICPICRQPFKHYCELTDKLEKHTKYVRNPVFDNKGTRDNPISLE